ncbi:MAG TPA: hypothetical protein DDZ91_11740 [Firmicutes bacterium]|jgi:DNA-directed RNA polymerase specialized sigma24 family protein|nr:hypothetical protein [Bacillota bacterium]
MPVKYDLKTIENIRQPYCERCGKPAYGWPHHIKTRGAGGKEDRWNLIQLCGECHPLAQQYKIPRLELVTIVAHREGMTVEEIYEKNNWLLDGKMPHEIPMANPVAGKTFEEVLELYLFCLEKGESSMWERAAAITVMRDCMGLKPRQIASAIGCSASLVRKMTRVFNAFPNEDDRIPLLSFRHHQIAAVTSDPKKWLAEAADNQWSTRILQEKISTTKSDDTTNKDMTWDKAEKSLLLIQEVLEAKDDAADWLLEEIEKVLNSAAKISA